MKKLTSYDVLGIFITEIKGTSNPAFIITKGMIDGGFDYNIL